MIDRLGLSPDVPYDIRYRLTTTELTALIPAIDCPAPTMSDSADYVEKGEAHPQGQPLTLGKTQSQTPVLRPATLCYASSHNGHDGRRQVSPRSSLQLSRSSGDGHRFTAFTNDDKESQKSAEADERRKFEVKWDGESDPENPRTMSHARKWLIVIIASTSSTCVCESLSHSRRGGF